MASYPLRLCSSIAVIAAVAALVAAASPVPGGTGGWRAASAPAAPAADSANLTALAMAGPSAGWTAGFTLGKAPGSPFEPLLASWNGHWWRDIGVSVGTPFRYHRNGLVLRWTGHRWVTAATPSTSTGVALASVTAVSPDDVWAVGQSVTGSGPFRAYALWNGHRWSVRPGPRDTAELNAAAFDGGHLTWAAGSLGPSAFSPLMQVRG